MLVLACRTDESIVCDLGDGRVLLLTVLLIDRGKVRLGLAAPASVTIHRSELLAARAQASREEVPHAGS